VYYVLEEGQCCIGFAVFMLAAPDAGMGFVEQYVCTLVEEVKAQGVLVIIC
jgi:hypothetical protein